MVQSKAVFFLVWKMLLVKVYKYDTDIISISLVAMNN